MDFIDSWREQIPDSIARLMRLSRHTPGIDYVYGLLATAVLWPIREPIQSFEGDALDAVRVIAGAEAKHILREVQRWPDDPISTTQQLADRAVRDEELRTALVSLIAYFDVSSTAISKMVGDIDPEVASAAGDIRAALVNIGGEITINELKLQVTRAIEIPAPPEPTRPPEVSRFVGRQQELADFSNTLATNGLAFIGGMAGAGKTTLAARLASQTAHPDQIFWHSFHEREGVQSMIWQLAAFFAWHAQDDLWQQLQSAQQAGSPPPPISTTFDYIAALVTGKDYLFCLDDFHFVDQDPQVEGLVNLLRPALRAGNLRLIITSRRLPSFLRRLDLPSIGGLPAEDVRALLEINGISLTDDLLEELQKTTAGNAEFLTLAIDAIKQTDDPKRLIKNLAQTDDVQRYLIDEVDETLTGDERDLMGVISVLLGYPADRSVIEFMLKGRSAARSLRRLSDRNLLTVQQGSVGKTYIQHAMIQGFYYGFLSRPEQRRFHNLAGSYYESEEINELRAGLHYQRGESYPEAYSLLTRDVWALINQGQTPLLNQLLSRFSQQQLPAELWPHLLLSLGQTYTFLGQSEHARASYEEALALLDQRPASQAVEKEKAEVYLNLGMLLEQEQPQEALEWLEEGLAMVGDSEPSLLAALNIRAGTIYMNMGNFERAELVITKGLEHVEGLATQIASVGFRDLAILHFQQGDFELATDYTDRALAISRGLHDDYLTAGLLSNLGTFKFISSAWPEAIQDWQQGLSLAERIGSQFLQASLAGNLGTAYMYLGDDDQAIAHLEKELEIERAHKYHNFAVTALYRLADLRIRQNRWRAAIEPLKEAEALANTIDAQSNIVDIDNAWAEIHLGTGNVKKALVYARKSVAMAREIGLEAMVGQGLRVLGTALAEQNEVDAALRAFEESSAILAAIEPYEHARTMIQHGKTLIERGQDVDGGRTMVAEAVEVFLRLGAKRDLEQARRYLREPQERK